MKAHYNRWAFYFVHLDIHYTFNNYFEDDFMTDKKAPSKDEQKATAVQAKDVVVEVAAAPSKDVSIHNTSARPITLIGDSSKNGRVTILPTETVQINGALWELLDANKAAQTFFTSGELRKV